MPNTRGKLIELLKRTFAIWCKKRCLKEIDRAIDSRHKAQSKANVEYYVMNALVKRYNELYNENLGVKGNGYAGKAD